MFGSFYAVCTLLVWLSIAIRSLLELKNLYLLENAEKDTTTTHHLIMLNDREGETTTD